VKLLSTENNLENPMAMTISQSALSQYHCEGYMILENCISQDMVSLMSRSCAELLQQGETTVDNAVGGRAHQFLFSPRSKKPELDRFNFGEFASELCRQTLGPDVWHINDQFSYKQARTGGTFHWHQDGAYIGAEHKPYLTVWITLCDMTEQNGTVRVVPRSRAIAKDTVYGAKELVEGYEQYIGQDTGVPVIVPAGSLAAFRSDIFHASTANDSAQPRIAYITQYSAEEIVGIPGQGMHIVGRPFLKDEAVVSPQEV
jgi:ectoine hydroxylase-related dioxygenase (phytanoyl-CoA dioxygenase family)